MKSLSLLFLIWISSSMAYAAWEQDFEVLKDIPRSYEDSGSICEEVARLEMQREYPAPQYDVVLGIAYGDETRVIGELDVVIFDNNLQKVVKIAEVKCWKDVRAGLEKAKEQRARFLKAVRSTKPLRFFSTSTKQAFDIDKFKYVGEFFSVAQKGSVALGFERELEYTLKEMRDYRYEMLRCQNQGKCARP